MGRPRTFRAIALAVVLLAGCDGASQCVHPSVYAADEARTCLGPAMVVIEVEACGGQQTRGLRTICLVDSGGQLYVATVSDSATVWVRMGWRYSDAPGTDVQLSAEEEMRCSDFTSRLGFPEPAKQCSP